MKYPGLFQELFLGCLEGCLCLWGMGTYAVIGIALAVIGHEEFLDGIVAFVRDVSIIDNPLGKISDAEPTPVKFPQYGVLLFPFNFFNHNLTISIPMLSFPTES